MYAISNFAGSYEDGFLTCEFKRPLEIEITDDNVPANIDMFKLLNDKYVIFLAEGAFRRGRLSKHRIKASTSEPLVRSFASEGTDFVSLRLLKSEMKSNRGSWLHQKKH